MTNEKAFHEHDSEPAQFLVEHICLLPRGRALDIAMGHGRNAVYLGKKGFQVEGVDISAESVESALNSARESGITLDARVADLENEYRIEPDRYDVIVCFNYLQRSLFPLIIAGLKPAGMLVYETFIVDQVQFGPPHNPDYLLKHNELLDAFRDLRCLRYREGTIDGNKAIASLIAEREPVTNA